VQKRNTHFPKRQTSRFINHFQGFLSYADT
jgi:hypothetical protein